MLQQLTQGLRKEAPMLLSVTGIAGFITATIMAARATPAAMQRLELDKKFATPEEPAAETFLEKARLVAPVYLPTVGMVLLSTGLVFGSAHIARQRYIAVSSLYMIGQQYLARMQEKVIERVGEAKFKEIQAATDGPPDGSEPPVMIVSGENVLCYDTFSDRYFRIDSVETIRRAINNVNAKMYSEMWVPLNEFYSDIKLSNIAFGSDIGWCVEDGPPDIRLSSMLTEQNVACVTISFSIKPRHTYQRLGRSSHS